MFLKSQKSVNTIFFKTYFNLSLPYIISVCNVFEFRGNNWFIDLEFILKTYISTK